MWDYVFGSTEKASEASVFRLDELGRLQVYVPSSWLSNDGSLSKGWGGGVDDSGRLLFSTISKTALSDKSFVNNSPDYRKKKVFPSNLVWCPYTVNSEGVDCSLSP